jgi:hypothetical protein
MLLHINIPYNYACAPDLIKLHTLQVRRHNPDALFSFDSFYDLNFVSLIDDIKLRVPSPNIRNFTRTMFPAALKNCPAGCATAATLE